MFSSSTSNELNDKTATELLDLINKREIGCVELINSCINRYEKINHSINAIVETNRPGWDSNVGSTLRRDTACSSIFSPKS